MQVANWYALNATRKYPLADSATGVDDRAQLLPPGVLADCQLRWPEALGDFAIVAGVTITRNVVAVTFVAVGDAIVGSDPVPIASVTLRQPVAERVIHAVTPLQPGVAGFVVFGDVGNDLAMRFSTPEQTLLVSRAAAPYPFAPVSSLGKRNRQSVVRGDIRLEAGQDLRLEEQAVMIDGAVRRSIVISLQPAVGRDVLQEYIGPCDRRPESRNCEIEPVETLGGVTPDCDGNINIVFENFSVASYDSSADTVAAGFVLDVAQGLPEVCPPRPTDYYEGDNRCSSAFSNDAAAAADAESSAAAGPEDDFEETFDACAAVPVITELDDDTDWVVESGDFSLAVVSGPEDSYNSSTDSTPATAEVYSADSLSRRNVSVYPLCVGEPRTNVTVTTRLAIRDEGTLRNGGLVLNHVRPTENTSTYFFVALDWDRSALRLLYWNGAVFIERASEPLSLPVVLGDWYELSFSITPSGDQVTISGSVVSLTDGDWPSAALTATVDGYSATEGEFGVGSNRSQVYFDYFAVEAV